MSYAKLCELVDASVVVKCSLILNVSLLLAEFWCQLVNHLG